MPKSSKVGDVFLISIEQDFGIGQIVDVYKQSIYVCVFDERRSIGEYCPDDVSDLTPLLATSTLDALLFHGIWQTIGNEKRNLNHIAMPVFKVRYNDEVYVESFQGKLLRRATVDEETSLPDRRISAPIILDNALKASYGIGPWEARYDEFMSLSKP
jgi:hypothetical protein